MRRTGIAAIALGWLTAAVQAGDMPALELRWRVDNHDPIVITPFGTDFDGDGVWNYFGSELDPASGISSCGLPALKSASASFRLCMK